MKCFRCHRPMQKPAATLPMTKGKAIGFGPKCAKLAGLLEPVQRTRAPVFSRPGEVDARQLALELSV